MILVDAHVHIYPCYNLAAFFNAAHDNFFHQSKRHDLQDTYSAFLLLADQADGKWFDTIRSYAHVNNTSFPQDLGEWKVNKTDDSFTLQLTNRYGKQLFLVAGRQLVTSERLEVLALFTDHSYADHQSIDETIKSIRADDAIPIIPWGVGKWLGKRGALLRHLLHKYPANYFMLGDNGGRPGLWPSPLLFKQARSRGTQILPGSDPLPIVKETRRPGSYGFVLPGIVSPDKPGSFLKQLVTNSEIHKSTYGKRHGLSTVIANQLILRLRK